MLATEPSVPCAQASQSISPLSIESGLVYMHSIWVPTNDNLQQYPDVFFTSPDIWDASVLDHSIFVDEFPQKGQMFDEFGIFTNEWYTTWMFSEIQSIQSLGSIFFMSISIRPILLR